MTSRSNLGAIWGIAALVWLCPQPARAHSGPPFPIVSDQIAGAYQVSIWADADTTDDGAAAGRFWVTMRAARRGDLLPAETAVVVSIGPSDRPGAMMAAPAVSIDREPSRRFVALLMDHEGPYRVHVAIDGPLGHADIDSSVDATYDLRPPRWLIAVYLLPFVLVGFLWVKLLVRRRRRTS